MASSLKRKDAFFLDFDTNQWLKNFNKKAEDFNGKGGAFERAVKRMIPMVEADFRAFMEQHTDTGLTLDTLMKPDEAEMFWGDQTYYKYVGKTMKGKKGFVGGDVKVDKTKNILFVSYGFNKDEGGLPAVFLDIGRPGIKYKNGTVSKEMKPKFFIYYSIEKNLGKFNQIFREEVTKELGGLL